MSIWLTTTLTIIVQVLGTAGLVSLLFKFYFDKKLADLSASHMRDQSREERQYRFLLKRLEEFYSPMYHLRMEILTLSELREEVMRKHGEYVAQQVKDRGRITGSDEKLFSGEREFNSKLFEERLLPAYKRMLDLFHQKGHLATELTRTHFPELVRFTETWNRWLAETIHPEVMRSVDRGEVSLEIFYQDIEMTYRDLMHQLPKGMPPNKS